MDVEEAYRDLVWSAESPSLIKEELTARLFSNLELERLRSGNYVEAFHKFLKRREASMSHKVGLYFELLMEFLISDVLQGEIIHRGEQVIENGRTVGEVDFIFKHDSAMWHLETAVKFYLFVPEACSVAERLVGPNSSDNFEAKMDRLFSHQLPLSSKFFPQVTKQVALVRGIIFYPWNSRQNHSDSSFIHHCADRLSTQHQKGIWCRAADWISSLSQLSASRYVVRKKPHWLSQVWRPVDSTDLFTGSEITKHLKRHFENSNRPLMLSSLDEVDDRFVEVGRIFVVDDTWPWSVDRA